MIIWRFTFRPRSVRINPLIWHRLFLFYMLIFSFFFFFFFSPWLLSCHSATENWGLRLILLVSLFLSLIASTHSVVGVMVLASFHFDFGIALASNIRFFCSWLADVIDNFVQTPTVFLLRLAYQLVARLLLYIFVSFYKSPENANFFIFCFFEVKLHFVAIPQQAKVVVKSFFNDPHHLCSLTETNAVVRVFFSRVHFAPLRNLVNHRPDFDLFLAEACLLGLNCFVLRFDSLT